MIMYLLARKRPDTRERAIWLRSNTKDYICYFLGGIKWAVIRQFDPGDAGEFRRQGTWFSALLLESCHKNKKS